MIMQLLSFLLGNRYSLSIAKASGPTTANASGVFSNLGALSVKIRIFWTCFNCGIDIGSKDSSSIIVIKSGV